MHPYFGVTPGGYGENDVFLGLGVPAVRRLARTFRGATTSLRYGLLASPIHEERFLALLLMLDAYRVGDAAERKAVFGEYLDQRKQVNNWDLVDLSAPQIPGAYLLNEGGLESHPKLLDTLSSARSLWDRRIALLATFPFIRSSRFDWTLRLCAKLLGDREDLIHKAAGWMLREVGKRDGRAAESFLGRHCREMPRTMLRYAVEKLPSARRRAYLDGRPPRSPGP
jgi:3-methyladenine DNA glycosylase AlkD